MWELGLVAALVLVIGDQLRALLTARRQGLTRNLSRVVTFSALLVLAALYGLVSLRWLGIVSVDDPLASLQRMPSANWGYLVSGLMIALLLAYEVAALVQARRTGLTTNFSRLVALGIAVVILFVLLGMSAVKWDVYLGQLEATFQDSLQTEMP